MFFHFVSRSPSTHKMAPWVKTVFLNVMPRILMMRRPHYSPRDHYEHDDEQPFSDNGFSSGTDFR